MTSHLSVNPISSPAAGPASSQPADNTGPLGAFGAMLDGVQSSGSQSKGFSQADDNAPAPSDNSATDTIVGALQQLLGRKDAGQKASGFSVPLAATEGTAATGATDNQDGTPPKLLQNLISAMGDLDQAEKSGGTVDDKLLKRVKDAIDAIAAFLTSQPQLAADPSAAGKSDAADAVGAAGTDKDAKAAAALAAAKDSLSKLADKLGSLSSGLGKDQADLADKLNALAKQLGSTSMSKTTFADLGLTGSDGGPADGKLAAAINSLIDGKQQSASINQPKLANPALKLPDGTTLTKKSGGTDATGKPDANAAQPTDKPVDPATQQAAADTSKDSDKTKGAATDIAATVKQTTEGPADASNAANTTSTANFATALNSASTAGSAPAEARQAQSAYQTAPINLPQMAVEVARHVQQGSDHFQIRLDPPEMGRVNVQLAIDSSGTVNAHLTVERSETLDFLKRDQANLQQALQQAGLDAGKTNLQFSLSQNPFTRQDNSSDPNAGNYRYGSDADADQTDAVAAVAATTIYRGTASAGGLNLFV